MSISSQTQSKSSTIVYIGEIFLTGPKRGEIPQLRPFWEALLDAWLLYRRSVANADQPMDLPHFRRKLSHVCVRRQVPCRVTRQLDGRHKGFDQRVQGEVRYGSINHLME